MNKKLLTLILLFWFLSATVLAIITYESQTKNDSKPVQNIDRSSGSLKAVPLLEDEWLPLSNYRITSKHKINGKIYVLAHPKDEYTRKYLFQLIDDQLFVVKGNLKYLANYIDFSTTDFWILEEDQTAYLINSHYDEEKGRDVEEIVFYDYSSGPQLNSKVVYPINNEKIYEVSFFINYNKSENTFLINTAGGDSCAGWGRIWSLDLDTMEKVAITDTSAGCSLTHPRFIKYTEDDELLMANSVECTNVEVLEMQGCSSYIYIQNKVNPKIREIVYEFETPYKYDVGYSYFYVEDSSLKDNEIVLYENTETEDGWPTYKTVVLDLETGKFSPYIEQ